MSNPVQNSAITDLLSSRIGQPSSPATTQKVGGVDFQNLLADKLKVSGHAQTRLESRDIQLGKAEWDRVLSGVDKAAQKGAKESLVLVDDVALVVSVRNRTVITAMDKAQLKDNVFTNIDSAVVV